ncbi:MAG: hypothetical protein WBO73_11095 [Gammaproteobacteria bacterium]
MITNRTIDKYQLIMVSSFMLIFFTLAIALSGIAIQGLYQSILGDISLIEGLLKAINMAVISLATYELGLVVQREYGGKHKSDDIAIVLRRTLPRFVSIVCVALVLEGLIMVIKYSQLDLAGNLYYPVAIITSTALLLMALGVFLRFTEPQQQQSEPQNTACASTRPCYRYPRIRSDSLILPCV